MNGRPKRALYGVREEFLAATTGSISACRRQPLRAAGRNLRSRRRNGDDAAGVNGSVWRRSPNVLHRPSFRTPQSRV